MIWGHGFLSFTLGYPQNPCLGISSATSELGLDLWAESSVLAWSIPGQSIGKFGRWSPTWRAQPLAIGDWHWRNCSGDQPGDRPPLSLGAERALNPFRSKLTQLYHQETQGVTQRCQFDPHPHRSGDLESTVAARHLQNARYSMAEWMSWNRPVRLC
jgi:hypothetical protein